MSEKNKKNRNKGRRDLPEPPLPCAAQLAGPADWLASVVPLLAPGGQGRVAGACAPSCRHGTCLPVLPLDAWTSGTSPRSHPGPFPLPLALPPPWFSLPRAHPSAAAAIARRCRGHRPPLASLTRFPAPPRPPLPPRQATHLRTRAIADAVVFFTTDAGDRPRRHRRRFAGRRTSPSTPACSASPP